MFLALIVCASLGCRILDYNLVQSSAHGMMMQVPVAVVFMYNTISDYTCTHIHVAYIYWVHIIYFMLIVCDTIELVLQDCLLNGHKSVVPITTGCLY